MAVFKNMDYLNENGISYVETENGVKYFIYTPENVTPDTEVFVYTYGKGTTDDLYSAWHVTNNYGIMDGLIEHGSDSVVIMPCLGLPESVNNFSETTYEIVNQVKEELNITNPNLTGSGFSWGGVRSLSASAKNIYGNEENIDPQVYFMVDDYSHSYSQPKVVLENWKVGDKCYGDIFKDNQSVFFFFEPSYKQVGSSGYNEANAFADYGLNTIKVICSDGIHTHINSNCWQNELFNFMSGTSELPTEGYTYKIRNAEGDWKIIDVNEINTLDKLYNYFGIDTYQMKLDKLIELSNSSPNAILLSDITTLSQYEQVVNNAIGKTNFVQNAINYGSGYCESTTKVPSSIPDIVNDFYKANADLLLKISNDVSKFVKIGEYFEQGDQKYGEMAVELGDITSTPSTIVDTTNLSTIEEENNTETLIDIIDSAVITTATAASTATSTPKVEEPKEETTTTNNETTVEKTESKETTKTDNTAKEETNKQTSETVTTPQQSSSSSQQATTSSSQTQQSSNGWNNQQSNNNTSNQSQNQTSETNPLEEFPEYSELYSDESKIVYDYNNEYRIVVHKDGDEIIGIEHYYNFGTETQASQALENLKLEYSNVEYMDNIMQKGQYVKVVFKEEMYNNLTLTDIKNKYSSLSEIVKL